MSSDNNIHEFLKTLLAEHRARFRNYHDALSLLSLQSPIDNRLTVAGELLKYEAGLADDELEKIIWVNLELGIVDKQQHKSTRMRPISIWFDDSDDVQALHKDLFTNAEAWEQKTKEDQWIALSDIMNYYKNDKNLFLFLVANENSFHSVSGLLSLGWFDNNSLMVIYPRSETSWPDVPSTVGETNFSREQSASNSTEDLRFFMTQKDPPDELDVNETIDKDRYFEKQVEWLDTFKKKKVSLYMGYENKNMDDVRLWAAFTDTIRRDVILALRLFYEQVHNLYLDDLRKTLTSGNLENFWEKTKTFDVHDTMAQADCMKYLKDLLGLADTSAWPLDLTDEQVIECLKTMCGKTSCFYSTDESNSEPLSLLGTVFIFMSAYVSRAGVLPVIGKQTSFPAIRSSRVLPRQSQKLSKETVMAMSTMFLHLIWGDRAFGNRTTVEKAILYDKHLEIVLNLSSKSKRSFLDSALQYAIASQFCEMSTHKTSGKTAHAIIKYWSLSNSSDVETAHMQNKQTFPVQGGLSLHFEDEQVILKLATLSEDATDEI